MTFPRIKAVGWQVNEKVTSPQLNQLDIDHSKSIDKTGDNGTNGGGVTGRIDWLSGSTLRINSGASIDFEGGALVFNSGSVAFNNSSGIDFNDSSTVTFTGTNTMIVNSTSSFLVAGTENITSGGTLGINSGATLHVKSGGNLYVDSGGTETVSNGGVLALAGGSNLNAASGSQINMGVTSFLNLNQTDVVSTGGTIWSLTGDTMVFNNSGNGFLTIGTGNTFNVHGTHKTDVWPKWNTPITRQSCMPITLESAAQGASNWLNIGVGLQNTNSASPQVIGQQTLNIPLKRLHNGATLASVFISFYVGTTHTGVPQNLPTFTVYRYQSLGGGGPTNVQYLSSIAVQSPTNPGSGSAWYDGGNVQYYQYVTNQNNVIDNTTWLYGMSVADESGTNSLGGNAYLTVTAENQVITDTSWNI